MVPCRRGKGKVVCFAGRELSRLKPNRLTARGRSHPSRVARAFHGVGAQHVCRRLRDDDKRRGAFGGGKRSAAQVGLFRRADAIASQLTKQRVAAEGAARALAGRPRLLLMESRSRSRQPGDRGMLAVIPFVAARGIPSDHSSIRCAPWFGLRRFWYSDHGASWQSANERDTPNTGAYRGLHSARNGRQSAMSQLNPSSSSMEATAPVTKFRSAVG